jgi:hypothetical protein
VGGKRLYTWCAADTDANRYLQGVE